MTLGVAYHTARVLHPEGGWYITTQNGNEIYSALSTFFGSFRMPAFFLLAGFFSALLLAKLGPYNYLRQRLLRIAVPLIACGLTLQLFVRRDYNWDTNFWIEGAWVGHLWFLIHLLIYMIFAAISFSLINGRGREIRILYFPIFVALLFMIASFFAWRLPELPFIKSRLFFPYLVFFIAGMYLQITPRLLTLFHNWRLNLLYLATGALVILLFWESQSGLRFFGYGLWAISMAGLLLYGTQKIINKGNSATKFLGDSSYTVYLFHEPLIIVIGSYLLFLNPHLFFASFSIGVTLLCWFLHAFFINRSSALSFIYNGRPWRW